MALEILSITDPQSGTTAKVLPGFGMNCFNFRVATTSGPGVEVLWAETGFEEGGCRASGSGIPLLFPFPGRIQGTELHWEGRTYRLPAGDGIGNAIHGFVLDRPWQLVEQLPNRIVGRFHAARDCPELLNLWPADFRISAAYTISPTSLDCEYVLENPDNHALPCGFGTHPYFRVPLGGSTANTCQVSLPVASAWQLESMNATGVQETLVNAAEFTAGMAFADLQLDNVFGDLNSQSGRCRCAITDPESGHQLRMDFDSDFREIVVYTPPHREAICIEPYTCVPDPFRLARQGLDAGLLVLEPGQSIRTQVRISLT